MPPQAASMVQQRYCCCYSDLNRQERREFPCPQVRCFADLWSSCCHRRRRAKGYDTFEIAVALSNQRSSDARDVQTTGRVSHQDDVVRQCDLPNFDNTIGKVVNDSSGLPWTLKAVGVGVDRQDVNASLNECKSQLFESFFAAGKPVLKVNPSYWVWKLGRVRLIKANTERT